MTGLSNQRISRRATSRARLMRQALGLMGLST